MVANGSKGKGRCGAVKKRAQVKNSKSGCWTKTGKDGKFIDQKANKKPFKVVRKIK
jgi:hypothetical protein